LYTQPALHCTLLYSNRSKERTIFYDELQVLAANFSSQLNVELLLSSSQDLLKARLTKFLLVQFIHERVKRKEKTLFYMCGPFHYMQMATISLLTEGIPADNIKKENFSTEKPVVKELPPDVKPHKVHLNFEGRHEEILVQYPETILQAAKNKNIMLPYSCEAGRCGTCSATCVQGRVWHAYNEVLVDRELQKGRILTCTGYPYGDDDVIINYP
jgi:ring-1,2-phenylacetyl-CoA epoxidase subunit PaaE